MVPSLTVPGGKPVTAEPGSTPKLPATVELPVLVTVVPAKIAKGVALPKFTVVVAAAAEIPPKSVRAAAIPNPTPNPAQRRDPPVGGVGRA
jgi:hypothetical protein